MRGPQGGRRQHVAQEVPRELDAAGADEDDPRHRDSVEWRGRVVRTYGRPDVKVAGRPAMAQDRTLGRGQRPETFGQMEVPRVGQDFFTEVTGPIPFGGLGSSDPLAFKVYQPDRLVLGTKMVDHLRPGVCFWHSFSWPGVDMFGTGTLDRPWLVATDDPMAAARERLAVAFEFFTKLGIPYYCFHDRDVAPEGASFAEFMSNLDAIADDALGYQERTGVRLLWGTANLFTPPALPGRRGHEPGPRGVRLRGRAGQAHARGDPPARRRELRPVGRPRGLRHAAQHRPQARGRPAGPLPPPGRGAQAQDRLHRPAAHRAQADGADQAPVRLRLGDGVRLPRPQRARGRVRA